MFDAKIYKARREVLRKKLGSGLVLLLGNDEAPENYPGNTYYFRQDSSFLYYFGIDRAGFAAIIDVDENKDIVFGYDYQIDDIIWMGPQPTVAGYAQKSGVEENHPLEKLKDFIDDAKNKNRNIHFLPQYRGDTKLWFEKLIGIKPEEINNHVSKELIKAVVAQREIKGEEEVKEIEFAMDIAYEMHTAAMKMAKPGMVEREIAGSILGIAHSLGAGFSFIPIVSKHGETLHNHYYNNMLEDGDIVVNDSGAESLLHYASDITRTIPVSGKFTDKQKEIYEIVLKANMSVIDAVKPGVKYRDMHLLSAKVIANGLKDLGLMKGDVDDAVNEGAHALFFPHGLGHMMGLDVHDMEGLGEDYVGYDENIKRSDQFGLAYLRLGKEVKPGFVFTDEPGCYFIPELIDIWKAEKRHADFLNYDRIEEYKDFGGIRIEDDLLITEDGNKVLGKPIPKTVKEVEETCSLEN